MKKRKKKVDYKTAKYRNSNSNDFKYDWDQCMRDQMAEYGNEETAAKVCAKIKFKTVNR